MPTLGQSFASYVPALVVRRFAADPTPLVAPEVARFPAAVLFADVSGFTALTERLARHGPAGAEELAGLLNAYFGQLIALIGAHGGEVVKFGGDALLALWPATEEGLAEVTGRAARCGLAVQAALDGSRAAEGNRLSLRVGIGVGDVLAMHVGGVDGRWQLLVAGAPLAQAGAAEQGARPGEVVASPQAWAMLDAACVGRVPVEGGGARLESLRAPLPLRAVAPLPAPPSAEAALRAYLVTPLLARLVAGQGEWVAELRRATLVFINLLGLDHAASDALEQTQAVIRAVQTILGRYEGSILRLGMDGKGTTVLVGFGLPPLAHEDDPVRGVQAARAVQAELRELGVRSAIGVTTGRVFCGAVGSALQAEYTVMGDAVNVAARLMQAAPDDVLCDAATYQAARARVQFEALPPLTLKGKREPVAIYRPRGRSPVPGRARSLFGRTTERAQLAECLWALGKGTGGVVVVEGEAGSGKSRLVADLLERAETAGVPALVGVGDSIERSTPYHVWSPLFQRLLGLDGVADLETRRARVLERLRVEPDLVRLAPLLNAVLPADLPENAATEQMVGQVRADNTRDLLVRVLAVTTAMDGGAARPLLLILEDAHWLDSASWALARVVQARVRPLLLVITARPMGTPLPDDYGHLLAAPGTRRLSLEGLPPEDARALVCDRLGVGTLPEPVGSLIDGRAGGNPFFCEELAYALRDAGLIEIVGGVCRVAPGVTLGAVAFPDTVQGVVTSRIDRLTPEQQLTLKVASVIGRVFASRLVCDVYPLESAADELADELEALRRSGLTLLETPEPDLAYLFKHVITQEVAYSLLLFAQRRQLHRGVAEWYERRHADDLAPLYPLLAYHWGKAEVAPKTIDFLEKAGEQALRGGAYQEVVGFFGEALALADRSGVAVGRSRRAHDERQLGEAYYSVGRVTESRAHLERALRLLGRRPPTAGGRLIGDLLGQLLRQALHRLWPAGFVGRSREARPALLEAARAYERLAEISFVANETRRFFHALCHCVNLAEQAGPSPELVRAYASMCLVAGVLPLHPLARAYRRLARDMTDAIHDLPALTWMLMLTGMYSVGVGHWAEARAALRQSVDVSRRLGDWNQWEESSFVLAQVAYYQGKFSDAAGLYAAVHAEGRRTGNVGQQTWGLLGQGQSALRVGHTQQAASFLEEASTLLATRTERTFDICVHGLLAVARLRQDKPASARREAEAAARLIAQGSSSPSSFYVLDGYAAVGEVYLALWEASLARPLFDRDVRAAAIAARRACADLRGYARVFPIGRPRAWLCEGWAEWLAGRRDRAWMAWRRSIRAAERLAMPYELGRAHYELGRHLPPDHPARRAHLAHACRIFSELGAAYDLAWAQAAAHGEASLVSSSADGQRRIVLAE